MRVEAETVTDPHLAGTSQSAKEEGVCREGEQEGVPCAQCESRDTKFFTPRGDPGSVEVLSKLFANTCLFQSHSPNQSCSFLERIINRALTSRETHLSTISFIPAPNSGRKLLNF